MSLTGICAKLLIAATLLAGFSAAQGAWLIVARGEAVGGQPLAVEVVILNDSAQASEETLAPRLDARMIQGTTSVDVTLESVGPPGGRVTLAPGAFHKAPYTVRVPLDLIGTVELRLADVGAATLFSALPSRRVPFAAPPASDAPGPRAALAEPAVPATDPDGTPPDRNLAAAAAAASSYEPMYFIVGARDSTSAKFQLSFKYRLLDEDTWLGRRFWPLAKLHLGYTQTSLWDIGKNSAPFRDTSYRPSVFYYEPNAWRSADARYSLSFSGGLEHESNGKDGASSRSINIAFVRPRLRIHLPGDYFVRLEPRLFAYIEKSDNTDISRYRGYGDYAIGVGHADEWLVNTTLRLGTAGHVSTQVDGSWRIRSRVFSNASGYLYAQYFNGYGESLLDYSVKRRSQIRIGFAIVR